MKAREYRGNDGEGQLEKQEDNQENSESRKDVVKTEGQHQYYMLQSEEKPEDS